jgi:hypothetical protein
MQQHTTALTVQTKQPTTSTAVTLSLRVRKTVDHKPAARETELPKRKAQPKRRRRQQRIRWRLSWQGLEEYRDQIQSLAREARDSDAAVREAMPSSVATGLICGAIRDPSTAPSADVARAANAQRDLRDLHAKLVWEHHLEFDFVRREWATILDPRHAEAELCERLVAQAAAREGRA